MLTTFLAWIALYKYLLLFPVAIIEGPIIAIVCGSLAASGQINFFLAYAIIVAGDITGDSLYYGLGRYGRTGFVEHWGHLIGLSPKRLRQFDLLLQHNTSRTLILGKLAFSLEIPFIFIAGLTRVAYLRFLTYMLAGALPKTLGLMLVGYFFGFSLAGAQRGITYASRLAITAILAVALVLAIRFFVSRRAASHARKKHLPKIKSQH